MAEAGCSKALVYWYWRNKADLFTHLIDLCMNQYEELLERTLASEEPFPERLETFFGEFTRLFRKNEDLNKVVHFGSLHAARHEGENFRKKVNDHYRAVQAALEALFREGVKAGRVREDVDLPALAFHLLMSVEGYIYMSMLEKRMPLERALLRILRSYLVPGILVQGEGGPRGRPPEGE